MEEPHKSRSILVSWNPRHGQEFEKGGILKLVPLSTYDVVETHIHKIESRHVENNSHLRFKPAGIIFLPLQSNWGSKGKTCDTHSRRWL